MYINAFELHEESWGTATFATHARIGKSAKIRTIVTICKCGGWSV
jgi:hypothetical protein